MLQLEKKWINYWKLLLLRSLIWRRRTPSQMLQCVGEPPGDCRRISAAHWSPPASTIGISEGCQKRTGLWETDDTVWYNFGRRVEVNAVVLNLCLPVSPNRCNFPSATCAIVPPITDPLTLRCAAVAPGFDGDHLLSLSLDDVESLWKTLLCAPSSPPLPRACAEWNSFQHLLLCCVSLTPQWGAADAEIKVPSGENTELKRSPFQAWSRSVYSHTCYAYCQGFLSCLFLHFRSIHLHFFQNLSQNFPCVDCG